MAQAAADALIILCIVQQQANDVGQIREPAATKLATHQAEHLCAYLPLHAKACHSVEYCARQAQLIIHEDTLKLLYDHLVALVLHDLRNVPNQVGSVALCEWFGEG